MSGIKRGDWVQTIRFSGGSAVGVVKRVSKDQSWVDVRWFEHGAEWSKRMRCSELLVRTQLRIGDMEVTDMTRESELAAEGQSE